MDVVWKSMKALSGTGHMPDRCKGRIIFAFDQEDRLLQLKGRRLVKTVAALRAVRSGSRQWSRRPQEPASSSSPPASRRHEGFFPPGGTALAGRWMIGDQPPDTASASQATNSSSPPRSAISPRSGICPWWIDAAALNDANASGATSGARAGIDDRARSRRPAARSCAVRSRSRH